MCGKSGFWRQTQQSRAKSGDKYLLVESIDSKAGLYIPNVDIVFLHWYY